MLAKLKMQSKNKNSPVKIPRALLKVERMYSCILILLIKCKLQNYDY